MLSSIYPFFNFDFGYRGGFVKLKAKLMFRLDAV